MAIIKFDPGVYADGSHGHNHTRTGCARILERAIEANGSVEHLDACMHTILALRTQGMSDDASEEAEACDWLNDHSPVEGHWWGWQDGDFGLWPESEAS